GIRAFHVTGVQTCALPIFTFQLELRQAVKREESKKLKQRLQGLEQKKKSGRFFSIIWKVAAVFIGGLGLLWFFNMSPDYEKIYKIGRAWCRDRIWMAVVVA